MEGECGGLRVGVAKLEGVVIEIGGGARDESLRCSCSTSCSLVCSACLYSFTKFSSLYRKQMTQVKHDGKGCTW